MRQAGKEIRGNCCNGVPRNALKRVKSVQFWQKLSFKPEEAARELEDLFPDSKLWQRPPFESELEAVWV